MLVMTPAQCGQGHQHSTGKDTNTASAGPSKNKSLWNDARYGDEATGKDDDHDNDAMHTDVLQKCLGWADASLQCWGQCQRDEGEEASATLMTTPAQRRQRRQRDACKDASAMRARTPAQCRQNHQRKIGRTQEPSRRGTAPVTATKTTDNNNEPMTTPRTLMCHDCIVTGRHQFTMLTATWVQCG